MKRLHAHVHVDDLAQSIAFYSKLFAAAPARVEADYAKWMLRTRASISPSPRAAPSQAWTTLACRPTTLRSWPN